VTAVVNYDLPVKNLIDNLSATGHVTHIAHKKTSVTLHHNGGRLSHEGVLSVWKTRPASAHFDVDLNGAVAQYVKVNEYAWATGNTLGNQTSISIEMANSKLAPTWDVSEQTWMNAARLSGWLFAKVIGVRPTTGNLFQHKHWRATVCAGPYIDGVWTDILLEAQRSYDMFKTPAVKPPTKPPTTPTAYLLLKRGYSGPSVQRLQQFLSHTFPAYRETVSVRRWQILSVDGSFGPQTEAWVKEFQHRVGISSDGVVGPQTYAKLRVFGY
jgi:peptidoglycan hydrolase-like protein with peptidoglycan-binding domain